MIPACWALWMTPNAPSIELFALIIAGAIFTSGAGCIANDLWDINIDRQVIRTKNRPLAIGHVQKSTALWLLLLMLTLSFLCVISLPLSSQSLCLKLAIAALALIIIYPSTKRWFKYPQAFLSLCWGFAVLIPWAASESNLSGGLPLFLCWGAAVFWTFGFDTVYAMADKSDDKNLGLNSSVITLGNKVLKVVEISYALTMIFMGLGAFLIESKLIFWPIFLIASYAMYREINLLKIANGQAAKFSSHFNKQVWIGSLILFGLVLAKV
tara:strand:- start:968 stop:1771 length:804 start_codon:yes stop_codon:yes gene_type:complete